MIVKALIFFSFLGPTIHRSHFYRTYNCFATQIKHQDISYICQCFSACQSEFITYKGNNLILTSKSVVLLLRVKMTNPVPIVVSYPLCYPVFNLFQGIKWFCVSIYCRDKAYLWIRMIRYLGDLQVIWHYIQPHWGF